MDRTKAVLESMSSMLASMDMQGLFVSAGTTREAMAEIDRLQQFRDRVLSAMTEHAGGAQEYAYIWQSEWDKIKAECGEPTDERKDER